jgi:hypothetical protein
LLAFATIARTSAANAAKINRALSYYGLTTAAFATLASY